MKDPLDVILAELSPADEALWRAGGEGLIGKVGLYTTASDRWGILRREDAEQPWVLWFWLSPDFLSADRHELKAALGCFWFGGTADAEPGEVVEAHRVGTYTGESGPEARERSASALREVLRGEALRRLGAKPKKRRERSGPPLMYGAEYVSPRWKKEGK